MFIINFCLNMFRALLCPSSGEQRPCVTAYGVLRWMWLVGVLGRCFVGCEHCEGYCSTRKLVTFTVLASYNPAPHNRYQSHYRPGVAQRVPGS